MSFSLGLYLGLTIGGVAGFLAAAFLAVGARSIARKGEFIDGAPDQW